MTKQDNKELLVDTFAVRFNLCESTGSKYIGKGVFARAGVPTANRRIYPESIWRKNINKLQEDIKSRKVMMELDHPCFYSDDFRVLTLDGWKEFKDVKIGDKVWSRQNGKAVISEVEGIINQPYSGLVYDISSRVLKTGVTPAHKFVTLKYPHRDKRQEELYTAQYLSENENFHLFIPKTAIFPQNDVEYIVIPGIPGHTKTTNDTSKDLKIDAKLFAAFMGIWLSEGGLSSGNNFNYNVTVNQANQWSSDLIFEEILSKFPQELQWFKMERGYRLADIRLWTYLKKIGLQENRYIPSEIKNLDSSCLKELIFWFTIGDGRFVNCRKGTTKSNAIDNEEDTYKSQYWQDLREGNIDNCRHDVFGVSEQLIRDLHECLVRSGGCGSISKVIPKDRLIEGRLILAENSAPLWQLHVSNSPNIGIRAFNFEPKQHEGNIYCLSVTHGNFYIEQNGQGWWTGNSDGKTQLQRVAALLTNLKLESNGDLIGEMEVIDGTPNGKTLAALVDANCTIGVSSRGYGSVKMNESGHDVVQDDYVLMTFDAVSDPANATSWPEFSKEGEAEESKQVDNKSVLTEVGNKEEETMVEQEQKSPKDAYKDMPVVPSPDPYGAVEVPKKYFGIFQKTDKEEYDFSVAKFIFTNKEDADEMAKKLTTDSETKDKSVFVAKEIDYSEILKKESKEEPVSDALNPVSEDLEDLKPWVGDIESIITDVAFYLKDAAGEEANKLRKILNALKGVKAILGEMKEDNEKLTHAAKEMAFRYFLEKSISHHPKYQEIVAGLGKLTKYESVEEIRSLIKVHVEEADDFVKTKQLQIEHRLQRMENDFTMKTEEFSKTISSQKRIVESKEKEIKSMREEISRLSESLKEEQAKVYLEQRLQGNPNAHSIRKAVTESRIFEKRIVDNLVESMTQPVEMVTESTTFKQVRDSLARKQKLPNNTLVEGAVAGTTISDVKRLTEESVNPLINQSMKEFRTLAGLDNK